VKDYLRNVRETILSTYGIDIQDQDLKNIDETIIKGNKSRLFRAEMDLCNSQKQHCIDQVHFALDTYHHAGMNTEEIKTIVDNVLTHKAPTPDITDTVRLLLAEQ
jgi:hypothetical protein